MKSLKNNLTVSFFIGYIAVSLVEVALSSFYGREVASMYECAMMAFIWTWISCEQKKREASK